MSRLTSASRAAALLLASFTGGQVARVSSASAAIVYVPLAEPVSSVWLSNEDPIPIDIRRDGTPDFQINRVLGFGPSLFGRTAVVGYDLNGTIPGLRATATLAFTAGQEIGPLTSAQEMLGLEWVANANFDGSTTNIMATGVPSDIRSYGGEFFIRRRYMAFRLEEEPGQYQYGWFDIQNSAANPWIIFIHGWAYESEFNTPILAGAVPEPSASLFLAISGGSLLLVRRRAARGQ